MSAPPTRARRAGGRWRFLAHQTGPGGRLDGGMYGPAIHISDQDYGPCEFDELVVGRWIHIEQMTASWFWMDVAGLVLNVRVDRDGNPRQLSADPSDLHADVEYRGLP